MIEEKQTEAPETEAEIKEKIEESYYTVKDIARKFNFTSAWISYLCKTGTIKATKPIGKVWRITPEEYQRIINKGLLPSPKLEPPTKILPILSDKADKVKLKPIEEEEKKPERYFPFNILFKD